MSGKYKLLKSLLLLLGVVHYSRPQTIESIATNFCETIVGIDNFSCNGQRIEEGNCFNRDELCSGTAICAGNEDEGDPDLLSSLDCKLASDVFSTQKKTAKVEFSYFPPGSLSYVGAG